MTLQYSLLNEPLIRANLVDGGQTARYTLPGLFIALARDEVYDFPALRPHQRHPWHAFLVQLAAIALHHAKRGQPFATEREWEDALLALTPEHPDRAAWCLIAPYDKPAFMQPPVPGGSIDSWSNDKPTPDSMDILVTSKNHDLKQERIHKANPDDWIFSLVSLQTQAPYPGSGNFGVARMNGGSSSRPGLGIEPPGYMGSRWQRDLKIAVEERAEILNMGFKEEAGIALLWLVPWDGEEAFSFSELDPFFIEICRRVRLINSSSGIVAIRTTSKGPRILKDEAKARKGNTGDLWTPVHISEAKSFSVTNSGFDYEQMVKLAFGTEYRKAPAQNIRTDDSTIGLMLVARAIAGGQSTTEGYHERRIPISPKMKSMLCQQQTDQLAKIADERVSAIGKICDVLKSSIKTLLDNAKPKNESSKIETKASKITKQFEQAFEQAEDARFFDDLNAEIEADDPDTIRLQWLLALVDRAESILKNAFVAGPQSGEQRYRARSAALSRFHGILRTEKTLPTLANYYRQSTENKEIADEPT
ncbi:MAG: type I-E CRISPR-associated protein Cse1/CasA [Pseudomonadota bacterium]|nr:type I-E CRISPR-associated protein Cse1/CasA [Pseudomonadota bacterium]